MIIFRAEAELKSPLPKSKSPFYKHKSEWDRSADFQDLNQRLIGEYEENKLPLLLQIATMTAPDCISLYALYDAESLRTGKLEAEKDIRTALKNVASWGQDIKCITKEEISPHEFNHARSEKYSFGSGIRKLSKKLGLDYCSYDTYGYQTSARIVSDLRVKNKAAAKREMRKLLPDSALADEVERIYSRDHPKDLYYGIPVHYKLSVNSDVVGDKLVDFITASLYSNCRLLSKRVTKIFGIENKQWDSEIFNALINCCRGTAVEIVLNGDVATETEYASQYHRISDLWAEWVKLRSTDTLFFFVENSSHPGFANQLLGKIDTELDIIEIKEGVGNKTQALSYFKSLLEETNMAGFYEEKDTIFEKGRFYSASEVGEKFNIWKKERLKDRVYSAYDQSGLALRIDKKSFSKNGSAYDELQAMAGLQEVKQIIKDIIAAYKVKKLRNTYYDSNDVSTRHMIFIGNPGTAKTTVARLLTEIMKENDILKTGAFIEVGRANLVGKYVGWTAQIVRDAFKRAAGGVLFIDEAYSLVDDSHSFGDEAINTIVQEMENKRGDVIVIFAGYPEKMKNFLANNEGLRSRIAFHVNFPDYSPEELMTIMEKMLKDREFTVTDSAKDKIMGIFKQVYTQEEYGNGRFVRNLLEQAVNRQAVRISEMKGEISREQLFELRSEDFDTNIAKQYEKKISKIGFCTDAN